MGHAVLTARPDGLPSTIAAVTKRAAPGFEPAISATAVTAEAMAILRAQVNRERLNDEQRAPSNIIHLESSQSHCNPKVECVQIADR